MAGKRRRKNPLLAVLGNPGTPIGRGVREIVYDRHATHGRGPWVHKFKRGDVEVRGLKDGRVLVESKGGARVWEKDGRAGWLTNPKGRRRRNGIGPLDAALSTFGAAWHELSLGEAMATLKALDARAGGPYVAARDLRRRILSSVGPAGFRAELKRHARSLLSNPGGTVARRRKRSTKAKARRTGGKRKPPRGFKSWKAYMQSIRPKSATTSKGSSMKRKRRKSRGGRRRSNPAARHSSGRRRHGRVARRRGHRRNPPMLRGIVGQLVDGAKGGALVVFGKVVSRAVPALIGVQPVGLLGVGVQTAVGATGALILGRFVSRELSRPFLYGVFANAFESLIRGWNLPILTPALGDETELHALAGYVPSGMAGYVNANRPVSGMAGDDAMPTMVMGASA